MDIQALKSILLAGGWSEFPADPSQDTGVPWAAVSHPEGLPACINTGATPTITLTPWRLSLHGLAHYSVSMAIRTHGPCGWVNLQVYGLPLDLPAIQAASEALGRAWTAIAQPPTA